MMAKQSSTLDWMLTCLNAHPKDGHLVAVEAKPAAHKSKPMMKHKSSVAHMLIVHEAVKGIKAKVAHEH